MNEYLDSLKTTMSEEKFYEEGGAYSDFMKFQQTWEPRLSPHGDFNKYLNAQENFYSNLKSDYQFITDKKWHELGPDKVNQNPDKGVGPVEFISFFDNGSSSSTQYMLTASLLGGLFYSTDYGETWQSTNTDTKWDESGCSWAVFHPSNHKIWYAASSGNTDQGSSSWIGKTGGIYRTEDEVETWTQIADKNDLNGIWTIVYKLVINPQNSSVLFAATSNGIFKTTSANTNNPSWSKVSSGFTYDLEL